MASKGKGNILFEILIVVLTVALIATIMYPSQIWKQQSNNKEICQTRMATVQQFELQYIGLTNSYSDSLDKMMELVLSDVNAAAALDSLIYWEGLVTEKELKTMILEKDLPQPLNALIKDRLIGGQSIGKLAVWDSVQYQLINKLQDVLAGQDSMNTLAVDSSLNWGAAINDNVYAYSVYFDMPNRAKARTKRALQKGLPVYETEGWDYLKPAFYDSLNKAIDLALQGDVWEKSENKAWEKTKRAEYEAELDALPEAEKDSLWLNHQKSFWDKVEPLEWQNDRKPLYRKEGEDWKAQNETVWNRMISQEWEVSRKKEWQEATLASLADSARTAFKAEKDSIWRSIVADLREEEFGKWEAGNAKHIEEVVRKLWEQERRLTWKPDAYKAWKQKREENPDKVWKSLKEYMWGNDKLGLWRQEEIKLSLKKNALLRLDMAVNYNKLIGKDGIESLVDGLNLPDGEGLLKKMKSMKEFKGSKLAALGVNDLFKDQLLANVDVCPLSKQKHLIHVDNMDTPKSFSIECPIVITDSTKYALIINKTIDDSLGVVYDSTQVDLQLTFKEKNLGGGKIENHGKIDADGRRSWEKKGR